MVKWQDPYLSMSESQLLDGTIKNVRHTKTAIYIRTTFERTLERAAEQLAMSRLALLRFRQVVETNASQMGSVKINQYPLRLQEVAPCAPTQRLVAARLRLSGRRGMMIIKNKKKNN